jgi:hypothetical protein
MAIARWSRFLLDHGADRNEGYEGLNRQRQDGLITQVTLNFATYSSSWERRRPPLLVITNVAESQSAGRDAAVPAFRLLKTPSVAKSQSSVQSLGVEHDEV